MWDDYVSILESYGDLETDIETANLATVSDAKNFNDADRTEVTAYHALFVIPEIV